MTPYEIYQKVREHLLTQNRPAKYGSSCKYLAENGLKCAVGCLIPAELYDPKIEGETVGEAFLYLGRTNSRYQLFKEILEKSVGELTEEKIKLLDELQRLHDIVNPVSWERRLDELAKRYFGCSIPGCERMGFAGGKLCAEHLPRE